MTNQPSPHTKRRERIYEAGYRAGYAAGVAALAGNASPPNDDSQAEVTNDD